MSNNSRRGRCHTAVFTLIAIQLIAEVAHAQDPPALAPVPKSGPQHLAETKIRQKYRDRYAAKDAASQFALAGALRSEAADLRRANSGAADELAMRFVLLREARELAVDAGEFHAAMRCIDDIARDFSINATEMKLSALAAGMDKATLPPDQLAEAYFRVVDDFLEVGDVDSAQRTMVLARSSERRVTRNDTLRQHRNEYEQKVAAARRSVNEVAAAARKLQKDPDQPALNQTVGVYLFNAGNARDGIALLAKSDEPALRELCARDLANPTDPAAVVELADAWWKLAGNRLIHPSPAHHRAAYWYQKALNGLDGDKKVNAENRLTQVEVEDAK